MLGRSSLHSCRASTRSAAASFTAVRTNATTAATAEQPADPQAAPAARRSRIPLANAFGDLAIPERDAIMQSNNRGSRGIKQNEFSDRGGLTSRLMNKRAQEIARNNQQQDAQNPDRHKSRSVRIAIPPQLLEQSGQAKRNGKAAAVRKETAEVRVKNGKGSKGEASKEEKVPERIVQETDLKALFDAPSSSTHQVVPLDVTAASPSALRSQRMLEKTAGDYSRYLPPTLASAPSYTLQKLGPVGYAHFALSRVAAAPLGQRRNALAIVSSLTSASPAAPSASTSS